MRASRPVLGAPSGAPDYGREAVEAHRIIVRRTDWESREDVFVVKVGRRVFFSQEADGDATDPEYANVALGIKTTAAAFERALAGKTVIVKNVASGYAYGPESSLALERTGSRIAFVAPCGAKGYITVGDAEKLVALLRSW